MFNQIRTKRKLLKLANKFKFIDTNYGVDKYELCDENDNIVYRAWVYGTGVTFYDNKLKIVYINPKNPNRAFGSKRFRRKFVSRLESPYLSKSIYE